MQLVTWYTVMSVMRRTIALLMLLMLVAVAIRASAVTTLCPEILPVEYAPYNYTLKLSLPPGISVLDALPVDEHHLLVALSNNYLLLLSLPSGLEQRVILNPQPHDIVYTRLPVDRLVPLKPGFAAAYGGISKDSIVFGVGLCGSTCINAWMLSALDSQAVMAYMPSLYTPTGRPLKLVLALSSTGNLYIMNATHPNVLTNITQTLPEQLRGGIVVRAVPIVSCSGVFYGVAEDVEENGAHNILVYSFGANESWVVATQYRLLDVRYYPALSDIAIAAVDPQGRLTLIIAAAYNPLLRTNITTRISSVERALIIPGSQPIRIVAYLVTPQPRLVMIEVNLAKKSYRILWSVPLPGQLALYSFIGSQCNPRYLLAAVVDEAGRLTLHLVRLSDGRHLWVLLVGIAADAARALHYAYGWFTAVAGDTIYLVHVSRLAAPLYALPLAFAAVYPNGTIVYTPFTARITCISGLCSRVVTEPLILDNSRGGTITVALPPGLYRIEATSPYAGSAPTQLFRILDRSECPITAVKDPGLTLNVTLARVKLCVWSIGDPQGWGFGRRPVPHAIITVVSSFGLRETLSTGPDGCVVTDLPPGNYNVTVNALGYRPATETITVNGTNVTYTIRIQPYYARVAVSVYAADTRQPLRDARIYVSEAGTAVSVKPFTTFYLPPGNYTIRATAPNYLEASLRLTIPILREPVTKNVRIMLKPKLYNTLLILVLEKPLHRNATAYISLTRIADGVRLAFTVQQMIPAGLKVVKILLRLPWGSYKANLIVPLHRPTSVNFTVPTSKPITVKLHIVQYRLLVRTIDVASGRPVRLRIVAVTAGYKTSFYSGTPVILPLGNYTLTVEGKFYRRVVKKISLNRDLVVTINVQPEMFPVEVRVYLQRKPLSNITVTVVGMAFDGIRVNKTVRTGKDGSAILHLLPGNYTFTAYYPVHSMFATIIFTAEKTVRITNTATVKLVIRPSPILYLLHMLPYILMLVIVLIIAAIFFALRHTIRDRLRKLREALAERLGGAPEEYGEEELEGLF